VVVRTNPAYQGWVPLTTWANDLGLGKPVVTLAGTNLVALLAFPGGRLALTLGRQQARWQDAEFWLAFAPRLVRGRGCIHALDVEKTLSPLLADSGEPIISNRVVVLDPGHGGRNPGAQNLATGRWEKEYTLDWARRLKPLLEKRGWKVFLTRTNDSDVPLGDRVALADAQQAGVFLSLHFNHAVSNPGEAGIETYCVTPAGLPSSIVRGPPEEPFEVLPNNAFDDENLRLALRLQHGLTRRTSALDRGVRRTRFMGVLRGQVRPAVLIEGGYLSNLSEARLIAAEEYRQRLAQAVAEALEAEAAPAVLPTAGP
jgi:N-acetylmuramoyl-L-alanine amidase